MRTIKLMADYDCFPLWEASPGVVGNIDPASLPISKALKADLMTWAESYNETLNRDDPAKSGFNIKEAEDQFKLQGKALSERLQAELGSGHLIKIKV